jgi:hypothetical protein
MSGPRTGYVWSGPNIDQIYLVRTDPLGKMSISHVSLLGILSNLIQRLTSTLGTTYSKDITCIEGYKRRPQE